MASKNGSQELISLLQYMKESRLDNPEILVKDKRIIELDEIVTEVKESEEWEGIRMNILDIGIQEGERRAKEEAIISMIRACKKLSATCEKAQEIIKEEFNLTEDKAKEYVDMHW